MPEPAAQQGQQNTGQQAPAQSFRERKAQQLRAERGEDEGQPNNPAPAALEDEAPPAPGDQQDVDLDPSQQDYADDDYADDLDEDDGLDPDEGTQDEDDPAGDDEQNVDWEKRYKDLQSETQSMFEQRGEMDREHAESMAQHAELRFEMEDNSRDALARAEFMRNAMQQRMQYYQNLDTSQIPVEQLQQLQQQYQQDYATAQRTEQAYQQMQQAEQQQRETVKRREAEVAKIRLRRTIPNWSNEVYGELRDFAAERGMPAEAFNDITDPVVIEALHAYKQMSEGGNRVRKTKSKRRPQAPRNKAQRRQPRDERGKFARKEVVPNQRGSFADKHRHRLAAERDGR
jgi:hypothetical protein